MRAPCPVPKYNALLNPPRAHLILLSLALTLAWSVGILGRGYWTPDEPREADIAWRMSWQSDKAVPLLAGEAFCEKPPLTYWVAGAAIRMFGKAAWAARLPNLLYAFITALGVWLLARRAAGPWPGWAAAAAISTFLLSYQAVIWLATDAPLLAAVSVALLGAYRGFYAEGSAERLRGYTLMHAALGFGFLSKSAAAWMVPVLTLATLMVWERRWRELLRWELYAGLALQAVMILGWVWFVYRGEDGLEHLKVFFWNNLVGTFRARRCSCRDLQYAAGHRNSPRQVSPRASHLSLAVDLLVAAAGAGRGSSDGTGATQPGPCASQSHASFPRWPCCRWRRRPAMSISRPPCRDSRCCSAGGWPRPCASTMHGIFARCAPRRRCCCWCSYPQPGLAVVGSDRLGGASHATRRGFDVRSARRDRGGRAALRAEAAARRGQMLRGPYLLLLAYCAAAVVARRRRSTVPVDGWQNLPAIGRAVGADTAAGPLILMAPDETTRAFIDMYARDGRGSDRRTDR